MHRKTIPFAALTVNFLSNIVVFCASAFKIEMFWLSVEELAFAMGFLGGAEATAKRSFHICSISYWPSCNAIDEKIKLLFSLIIVSRHTVSSHKMGAGLCRITHCSPA